MIYEFFSSFQRDFVSKALMSDGRFPFVILRKAKTGPEAKSLIHSLRLGLSWFYKLKTRFYSENQDLLG